MTKYKNLPTFIDDIPFDSKIEAKYYEYLKDQLSKGEIKSFILQPVYELTPSFEKNGKKIRATTYTPDFLIRHLDDSMEAIDIKGFPTMASELKKKWFDYRYPNIKLNWICYIKKYGGWIEISELRKKRKEKK